MAVLSRLVPHKQIEDALDAVAALRPRIPGLHLDIVAEGVETESQLTALHSRGCQMAQGYLLSRPIEAEAIWQLLQEQKTPTVISLREQTP